MSVTGWSDWVGVIYGVYNCLGHRFYVSVGCVSAWVPRKEGIASCRHCRCEMMMGGRVLEGLHLSDLDFCWRVVMRGGLVVVFACIPMVCLWDVCMCLGLVLVRSSYWLGDGPFRLCCSAVWH